MVHPENEALARIFTPLEHCRLKGIPAYMVEGVSDTTAHQILGQSVIYPAFVAVAKQLGTSIAAWCRLAQQAKQPVQCQLLAA